MSCLPIITIDVDWAPDYAIDYTAQQLIETGVGATWFVTHDSPAVRRLREREDLFELGIHPNFLRGSTHGATEEEVIAHCMNIVPEAKVMRTHGLVQTSNLLRKFIESTPIRVDVSLFLPHARHLSPVVYYYGNDLQIVRVHYMWEDDFEMVRPNPCFDLGALIDRWEGLMVMGFHPIHVFLNSTDLTQYSYLRSLGRLEDLEEQTIRSRIDRGSGANIAFGQAINRMRKSSRVRLVDFASL